MARQPTSSISFIYPSASERRHLFIKDEGDPSTFAYELRSGTSNSEHAINLARDHDYRVVLTMFTAGVEDPPEIEITVIKGPFRIADEEKGMQREAANAADPGGGGLCQKICFEPGCQPIFCDCNFTEDGCDNGVTKCKEIVIDPKGKQLEPECGCAGQGAEKAAPKVEEGQAGV